MMKFLFLDIDGVLNDHTMDPDAHCCGIDRDKIKNLNGVIRATQCRLVLSSAWRYMIHGGALNLDGFKYLLMTHGLLNSAVLYGYTEADVDKHLVSFNRFDLIFKWLKTNGINVTGNNYAIVDDLDFDTLKCIDPDSSESVLRMRNKYLAQRFVKCASDKGLDTETSIRLIKVLNT